MGVNDKAQLARMERHLQLIRAKSLMRRGHPEDPARFDLRGSLTAGRDVELDINVVIAGDVVLGNDVKIGANTVIRNSRIGRQCADF